MTATTYTDEDLRMVLAGINPHTHFLKAVSRLREEGLSVRDCAELARRYRSLIPAPPKPASKPVQLTEADQRALDRLTDRELSRLQEDLEDLLDIDIVACDRTRGLVVRTQQGDVSFHLRDKGTWPR